MEEQLIIEIWETFKDYIPEKQREIAANQYVDFLQGRDIDLETFQGLLGYDPHLDDALNLVIDEFKELEDEDEESEFDDWGDEEEDY